MQSLFIKTISSMNSESEIKKLLIRKKAEGAFPSDWVGSVRDILDKMNIKQKNEKQYLPAYDYIKVYFAPSKSKFVSKYINDATIQMLLNEVFENQIKQSKIEMMGQVDKQIEETTFGLKIELYNLKKIHPIAFSEVITEINLKTKSIVENIRNKKN